MFGTPTKGDTMARVSATARKPHATTSDHRVTAARKRVRMALATMEVTKVKGGWVITKDGHAITRRFRRRYEAEHAFNSLVDFVGG
jgi:hypothetical protein